MKCSLTEQLESVQLAYLVDRQGGWATQDNWEDVRNCTALSARAKVLALGYCLLDILLVFVIWFQIVWMRITLLLLQVLSLGEQQRLGMARLFFHKPAFGVLDQVSVCSPKPSHCAIGR